MSANQQQFGPDWTSHHFPDWHRWLGHLAGQPIRGAEIGCFEGRATVWFLQHILTHPASTLYAIDPWCYADEQSIVPGGATAIAEQFDWPEIYRRWWANTEPWRSRINVYRRPSRWGLRQIPSGPPHAPLAFGYIDGSHMACAALEDAVLLWPLLGPGGILIWDDYDWRQNKPPPPGWPEEVMRPQAGIDAFLRVFFGQYDDLEHSQWQIKIRKK